MEETYCGKLCNECSDLESGLCSGCKTGPGRKYSGDCNLASCARAKGHESCGTCSFQSNCEKYRNRYQIPEERARKAQEELARHVLLSQRATVLGKWLWILFWLVVPGIIGSFLANDYTEHYMPTVFGVGEVIQFGCSLIYGLILLKLTSMDDRYMSAGICTVISAFGSALTATFTVNPVLSLLVSIPGIVIALYGEHSEYMAHSSVLMDIDPELGLKWETLWKWYLGLNIGTLCSAFLIVIPLLGALLVFGCGIGLLVIAVLKLVYLYRSAKAFREY